MHGVLFWMTDGWLFMTKKNNQKGGKNKKARQPQAFQKDLSRLRDFVFSSFGKRHHGNSIVPERSVASQTLIIVVAIMSFLTCLTFATVMIVWQQASNWQNDISSEVTIQIRPIEGVSLSEEIAKAIALAENTPGIARVSNVDDEWSKKLLEPWLGRDFDLSELPVPRMLILELDPARGANLEGLAERLKASVPGATLDDHRLWLDRLGSVANTAVLLGFIIMGLMLTAMILSVTFATHGAMTSNHDVLEVLHFVGGRDAFIASEFQRRFLLLGLKGAFMGGGSAIVCLLALNFWSSLSSKALEADQLAALFGRFQIGLLGYFGAFMLIVVIAVLTGLTSRIAVFRYLAKMS